MNTIGLAIQGGQSGRAGGRMEERGGRRQGEHPAKALRVSEGMNRGMDLKDMNP